MDELTRSAPEETLGRWPSPAIDSAIRTFFSSKLVRRAAGLLGVSLCLFWVFHDTNWKMFVRSIGGINWWWGALGVLLNILGTISQGYRWHLLLKPLGSIGAMRTTQAFYTGAFINDILPMNMGEIARGYLVSVWMSKEMLSIIPSMALERLFEAVWLAIGIGFTAILVPLPKTLDRAADIFGTIVLGLVGLVLFVTIRKKGPDENARPRKPREPKPLRWLFSLLDRLREGFRSIGLSRTFYTAFFVSMLLFTFQAVSFWFITKAYGLHFSFWVGAAIFFIIIFGTALPNAPANIGTSQFFCVVGLTVFSVEKTTAAGFSLVAFVFLTLPSFVLGFFALTQSGMKLASIRKSGADFKRACRVAPDRDTMSSIT